MSLLNLIMKIASLKSCDLELGLIACPPYRSHALICIPVHGVGVTCSATYMFLTSVLVIWGGTMACTYTFILTRWAVLVAYDHTPELPEAVVPVDRRPAGRRLHPHLLQGREEQQSQGKDCPQHLL